MFSLCFLFAPFGYFAGKFIFSKLCLTRIESVTIIVTVTAGVTIKIMASSRFAIAVHTLALMANYENKPLKSETIACFVRTNPVVIRRLLSELGKAELVESQSGANGGSRLRLKPEEISLWQIYQAVETNAAFEVHHPLSEGKCTVSRNIQCVLVGIQNQLDKAVCQTLRGLTLANVLKMIEEESGETLGDGKCFESREISEIK